MTLIEQVRTVELHREGVQKCIVWIYGQRCIYLKVLIVKPEFRGKGVGSAVLFELKQIGLPIHVYPLALDGDQRSVERFYARNGFKDVGWYQAGYWQWCPSTK